MENNNFELKAYKLLAEIRGRFLDNILREARNKVQYGKPEDVQILMEYIANPAKWDYCGLLNIQDKIMLETLEYLLNDRMETMGKYTEWKPIEK